jgi:hypothetical protein
MFRCILEPPEPEPIRKFYYIVNNHSVELTVEETTKTLKDILIDTEEEKTKLCIHKIGEEYVKENLDNGKEIEIPSLDIKIKKED